jgi:opacity protein-like surface antigen
MSRAIRTLVLIVSVLLLAPRAAHADLTAFIGAAFSGKPQDAVVGDSHTTLNRGLSVGFGLLIVGFEFEWSATHGEEPGDGTCVIGTMRGSCAPSLTTVMGNVLLQTPRGIGPVQVYGTVGAGGYRERYEAIDASTTSVGTNVGGGVKINLLGPLRVRVDYRVFKLSGGAVHVTPQRLYIGANLAF